MRIIGIETSCDETGIAIYDDEKGRLITQHSQMKLHADYGGVVRSWLHVTMLRKPSLLLKRH